MILELLKDIFEGLLTPFIALITINISYQQWLTNEKMRRQELFGLIHEKLYKPTVEMIEVISERIFEDNTGDDTKNLENFKKTYRFYKKLSDNIRDYYFLILKEDEAELKAYLKTVFDLISDIENAKNEKEKKTKIAGFVLNSPNDMNNIKILFEKYLKFENQSLRNRLRIWYRTVFVRNCVLFFPIYFKLLYMFTKKNIQLWTELGRAGFVFLTKKYSLKNIWQEISRKVFIIRKSGNKQEPCTCKASSTSVNDAADQTPDKSIINNT